MIVARAGPLSRPLGKESVKREKIDPAYISNGVIDPANIDVVRQPNTARPVWVNATVQCRCDKGENGTLKLLIGPADPPTEVADEGVAQYTNADVANASAVFFPVKVCGFVPKGWFYKLETSGTGTWTLTRGRENIL